MATFCSQMKVLLWRNFLLKKRNKKQLIKEMLYPLFLILLLAIIKMLVKPRTSPAITEFPTYSLGQFRWAFWGDKRFLVTPNTPEVKAIMTKVKDYDIGNIKDVYFPNEKSAESSYRDNPDDVCAGLIFYSADNNLSYAIRVPYDDIATTSTLFVDQGECRDADNGSNSNNCDANTYLSTAFLWLQHAVESAYIQTKNSSFNRPSVFVKMMPKGEYISDLTAIQGVSSVYFVMAYSFFINFLSVNLVAEKEKKIREGMKMMGLRDSVFWLSWGSTYAVVMTVETGLIGVILFALSFFSQTINVLLFILMMLLYGLSVINLAFMLTTFFDNAQVAGIVTSFATIATSCLYFTVSMTRELTPAGYHFAVPPSVIWILCLLSPVANALGIDQAMYLDTKRRNAFEDITTGEFPLYGPVIMLIVDIVLYGILAIYFDHVIPGEYGPRYPPWYCFMPSYYNKQKKSKRTLIGQSVFSVNKSEGSNHSEPISDDIEQVSADVSGKAGLRLFGISKDFKSDNAVIHAVKGISLDVYEGQITALLGHNGAGKTTLINMLCGLSPPSNGCATIYDMDVSNSGDMERIRKMCGVCPQHNILYDDLTTMEHLKVFAGIKGVPSDEQETQIRQAMQDADISDQADTFARNLSGGQKRKLSVAMALIGNPKIIFLDEPTAGMDPYSRRHLWSLLQKTKKDRIILLSTHFMDEADILADRKAIISHGKLRCCGSSLFLKNRFGIGYHLDMVVESNSDSSRITDTLSKHVQGVEMKRSHAKELSFTMPLAEVSKFSHLFSVLEEKVDGKTKADILGIKSYGVSMTTLEEVFLKIGEEDANIDNFSTNKAFTQDQAFDSRDYKQELTKDQVTLNMESLPYQSPEPKSYLRETNLTSQQFWTLLKIRFLIHRRSAIAVVFQVILPITFVVIGCVLNKVGVVFNDGTNPAELSFQATASHYAASYNHPAMFSPSLIVKDSQGDEMSAKFISEVNKTWKVDQVNKSIQLFNLPEQHALGFDLQTWNQTMKYTINYTALYNDSAVHSLPVIINIMSNNIHNIITNTTASSINCSSLPWPSVQKSVHLNGSTFSATMFLALAFVLIAPGFSVHMVRDRLGKFRSQLRVAGVTFNLYWSTIFTLNITTYIIPAIICIIIVAAAKIDSFNNAGALVSLSLVFLTFMPAMVLLAYVFSFAFDKFESCQAILPTVFILSSMIPYVVVAVTDALGLEQTAQIVHYVFSVIDPPYILSGGIYYIDRTYRKSVLGDADDIPFEKYFQPSSHILASIFIPLVHMILLYILLRVLDVRNTGGKAIEAVRCRKESKVEDIPEDNYDIIEEEDEDVKEERNRVSSLERNMTQNSVAYVQNLRKEYKMDDTSCFKRSPQRKKVKVAVRNATFAVDRGEVLGLLGPNGAGKTTTLNMIIAETGPTRGKVMVDGHNVCSSMSEAFKVIGYCPQHDALWDNITLREHIEFYSLLRGQTKEASINTAKRFIESLKVEEHADKGAKKLSGGTRRKLSYALSMLGSPQFVLMDEPSTGMDPQSKRFLWDTISSSFEGSDRGAILTTHYMEEADALCSRVGIMVNGQLECLGPTQHLKDKFGSGYLLEIKLKQVMTHSHDTEQRMDSLERHLVSLFPHATCMERFEERGQYKIPKQDVISLAATFSSLEQTKHSHDVEEYSFSQSTLEQVFLDFAKKQHQEGSDLDICQEQTLTLQRQLSGGDNQKAETYAKL